MYEKMKAIGEWCLIVGLAIGGAMLVNALPPLPQVHSICKSAYVHAYIEGLGGLVPDKIFSKEDVDIMMKRIEIKGNEYCSGKGFK